MDLAANARSLPFRVNTEIFVADRDRIYGAEFRKQVEVMNINEVLDAPRSPWPRA
jgi:hypothetical protein